MISKKIENLKRKLKRLEEAREKVLKYNKSNEPNLTYWGGWDLGYLTGKISATENQIDYLEYLLNYYIETKKGEIKTIL